MLSQTSLKGFEEGCHRKWEGMWLLGTIPFYSNLSMDKGSYFEYLCIGGGAIDGHVVDDLPRKRDGSKTIDQIRIEEQAERFKQLFDENHDDFLGFKIKETQQVIWSKDKLSRGVIDIRANDIFSDEDVMLDLKLTSDVDAVRHPKHWGHSDDKIDITQSKFYCGIEKENLGYIPRFEYLVFDYSTKKQVKRIKSTVYEEGIIGIENRKQAVRNEVKNSLINGFKEIPSKWDCKTCPLQCNSRVEKFNPE